MILKKYLTFAPFNAMFLGAICLLPYINAYQPPLGDAYQSMGNPQQQMMPPFFDGMSENEKAQMLEVMSQIEEELKKLSPEELNELEQKARKDLLAMGINPDTLEQMPVQTQEPNQQPINTPQQEPTDIPVDEPQIPIKQPQQQSVRSTQSSTELLQKLIRHLEGIRQKTAIDLTQKRRLEQWKEAIDDLIYYLKVINRSEHHERLSTKEFDTLFAVLSSLELTLSQAEPQISTVEKDIHHDNPYAILGVKASATDAEIHRKYKTLIEQNDPDILKKKLSEDGLDEKSIKRQLKSAKLLRATITDAYDKVSDPKVRAQTDRSLRGQIDQQTVLENRSEQAVSEIVNELSQAIYQKSLITLLEQFLQKYEPTELALKKEMEAAQAKRKTEQQAASKIQASVTGGTYSIPLEYNTGYQQDPGYAGGYPSYYPQDHYQPGYHTEPLQLTTPQDKPRDGGRPSGDSKGGRPARPGKPASEDEKKKVDANNTEEIKKKKDLASETKKSREQKTKEEQAKANEDRIKKDLADAATDTSAHNIAALEKNLSDMLDGLETHLEPLTKVLQDPANTTAIQDANAQSELIVKTANENQDKLIANTKLIDDAAPAQKKKVIAQVRAQESKMRQEEKAAQKKLLALAEPLTAIISEDTVDVLTQIVDPLLNIIQALGGTSPEKVVAYHKKYTEITAKHQQTVELIPLLSVIQTIVEPKRSDQLYKNLSPIEKLNAKLSKINQFFETIEKEVAKKIADEKKATNDAVADQQKKENIAS